MIYFITAEALHVRRKTLHADTCNSPLMVDPRNRRDVPVTHSVQYGTQ
jgi:hypothetical protein